MGFDVQEVKRLSESDDPNAEAYGLPVLDCEVM